MIYNDIGDKVNKIDKIILTVIALIVIVPITINEIKEYNLRSLKRETLKISEILKNESEEIVQIDIKKDEEIKEGVKTRGKGKAFIDGKNVLVVLSYKGYCSVKIPGIDAVSLSKSKCQNLELIDDKIVVLDD